MLTYAGLLLPVALIDSAGNAQPRLVAQIKNLDGTAATVYSDASRTPLTGSPASDDAGNLQGFYAEPGVYLISFSVFGEAYTAHTLAAIDPRELTQAQAAALAAVTAEQTRALTAEGLLQAAVVAEAARAIGAEAGLLPKTGGALTGDLAAAGHRVTGLADPASAQDAATRAYVLAVRDALVAGAPGLLDTLAEIDAQLTSDETAAAALASRVTANETAIALKAAGLVATATKTAAYTAAPGDLIPVSTAGGPVPITLPAAPAAGSRIVVKHTVQGAANVVTIAASGTDHFNTAGGPTTATLTLLNQAIQLQYAGGVWLVVADDLPLSQLDARFLASPALTGTPTVNGAPVETAIHAAGAYVSHALAAPPASPAVGQEYLSSALRDLRASPALADRYQLSVPSWAANMQEPSLWEANGRLNMLYTGGSGLGYAYCLTTDDPTVAANWTYYGSGPVIGSGVGGLAGLANHASVYVEGNTLYCFANIPADNTIKAFTAALSDPTTWTAVGTVMTLPAFATLFGNTNVVKDGSTYWMLIEYKETATSRWQLGWSSCATVTGTYAMVVNKIQTLWPDATDRAGSGGPDLHYENGEYVLYYHSQVNWNGLVPCEVFRATAPSVGADNFTITDGAQPIIRRIARYEVDQVADVVVLRLSNGDVVAMWAGVDNRAFTARMYVTKLVPTRKRWNGLRWLAQEPTNDSALRATAPAKVRSVYLTADFTTTLANGSWENVTGAAMTAAPTGTDAEISFTAICAPTGSSGFSYLFQVLVGGVAYPLGMVAGTVGVRTLFIGHAKITPMVPGAYKGITVQVKVQTGGGTLNIRPVGQAGMEYGRLAFTDTAYPI